MIDGFFEIGDFVEKLCGGFIVFGELFELSKEGDTILETFSAATSMESLSSMLYFLSFFSED